MASTPGVEPGPHWWEARALTTAPPLLPCSSLNKKIIAHVTSQTQYFTSARFYCARTVPSKNELRNANTKVPSLVYVLTTSLQFYLVGSF